MGMFPACCFRQRIYLAQGHVNGAPNKTSERESKSESDGESEQK